MSPEFKVMAPVRVLNEETPPGAAASAACTNAQVASWVELVPEVAVGAAGNPVKVGEAISAPPALVMSVPLSVTAPDRLLNEVTPPPAAASARHDERRGGELGASCRRQVGVGAAGVDEGR